MSYTYFDGVIIFNKYNYDILQEYCTSYFNILISYVCFFFNVNGKTLLSTLFIVYSLFQYIHNTYLPATTRLFYISSHSI